MATPTPAQIRAHWGLNPYHQVGWELEANRVEAQRLKDAGVLWGRMDVTYGSVAQDGPDDRNWTALDNRLHAYFEAGLQAVVNLDYSPKWLSPEAAKDSHWGAYNQTQWDQLGAIAHDVAARYGPQGLERVEIANEPNHVYWTPKPDPDHYMGLVKAVSTALRAGSSSIKPMAGGTAPSGGRLGDTSVNPQIWYEELYKRGLKDLVHTICHHPYPNPGQADPLHEWSSFERDLPALRDIMVRHGHTGRRIWGTETGYNTCGPRNHCTPAEAAQRIPDLLGSPLSTRKTKTCPKGDWASFCGVMFYFNRKDDPQTGGCFGLVDANERPKPGYAAFRHTLGL